ncbi:MAG: S46 family peptidase [Bacteroidales bacterium]|nr:S46 family peptidase [Bacteroidales bacterium]MDD4670238.1 S46 family peptidase [Bacteroidales bacterium]
MKKFFCIFLTLFMAVYLFADDGMWLPSMISQRIADMQSKGFKLSAEDIYSINKSSLKDAVVHFNGGCTGELISDNGLLITNYHCGYSQIQSHSSVEHDYLRDGFWAMTMDGELPNKNIYVRFLVRMDDVTDLVLVGYNEKMTEIQRDSLVKANSAPIISKAKNEGVGYSARVEPLYYGNQYFIFVYQTFTDVRLVGAPPTAIGKFGGDTDNWMWPRHTGDFSLFRIYADKNNNPAAYSPDNIPYKPKMRFKMSVRERKEGDFTLVYGYPGRTQEYLYSEAVRYISDISNPNKYHLRTLRLEVQDKYMSQSQAVRIQYASKNSSVSNAWKKWFGEMKGIKKMKAYINKKEYERQFAAWAADKSEYNNVLPEFARLYAGLEPYSFASDYYNESIKVNEITAFADRLYGMATKGDKNKIDDAIDSFFKDYYLPIDKESFILLLSEYSKNVPDTFKPAYYFEQMSEFGSVEKWAEYLFNNSALNDKDNTKKLINKALASPNETSVILDNDPAFKFSREFKSHYEKEILKPLTEINREITLLYRTYMKGQMEFDKERVFFPDANSTLRIAYGKIMGYAPADAIYYSPISTIEGIMQKDNPEIFDYNIPQKLRDLYAAKDYGKWSCNGTMPVCFIATNHTTGGNSGSPVIDADGNLIGINFDRVWEGTMSDIVFDPDICRNISLDMRYVLFIIDKLAGAQRILDEIEVVE